MKEQYRPFITLPGEYIMKYLTFYAYDSAYRVDTYPNDDNIGVINQNEYTAPSEKEIPNKLKAISRAVASPDWDDVNYGFVGHHTGIQEKLIDVMYAFIRQRENFILIKEHNQDGEQLCWYRGISLHDPMVSEDENAVWLKDHIADIPDGYYLTMGEIIDYITRQKTKIR